MPIEKSAGAVIFRKDDDEIKYLLIQYEAGHRDFPRGLIEKGEALEATARRKIGEETGLTNLEFMLGFKETTKLFFGWPPHQPAPLRGARPGSKLGAGQGSKNILKFVTYFLTETKQKEVKLSYEHKDFIWLSYEQALEQITYQNSKQVLSKAHQFLVFRQSLIWHFIECELNRRLKSAVFCSLFIIHCYLFSDFTFSTIFSKTSGRFFAKVAKIFLSTSTFLSFKRLINFE